jgi:predicted metal-dependent hydrolase
MAFALEFARKNSAWIEHQLAKRQAESQRAQAWTDGAEILFRGERVVLRVQAYPDIRVVQFADQTIPLSGSVADLRATVEHYLWALAAKELVPRTWQLATQHELRVNRVVVRNQHTRWGSCSIRRTISLNWRLIQAPPFVRDYLIVHELMHLHEMNHSKRFWKLVRSACPEWAAAELWLNSHAQLLR